jgi:hypothetical protein
MSISNWQRPKKNLARCRYCGMNIWNKRRAEKTKCCTKNCKESLAILEGKPDPLADELRAKFRLYGGNLYTTIRWLRIRKEVLRKFDRCLKCGSRENLHVDHISPVAWGRAPVWSLKNLQVLCRDCNLSKKAKNDFDHRPEAVVYRKHMAEAIEEF